MLNLHGDNKNFNTHVGAVGRIMSDPSIKFIFVDKIPAASAAACFDHGTQTIYLPAVDPNRLTEEEARKIMGYSAHERKHAKLTSTPVRLKLNEVMDTAKANNINRKILHALWQMIEDLRIEMNENYAYRGDLSDIAYVREIFFQDYKAKEIELFMGNPLGYVMECVRYQMLAKHESFIRGEFLTVPESLEEYYEVAMKIMNDGRFMDSLLSGLSSTKTTLELAIDIEAAWAAIKRDNKENEKSDEEKDEKSESENDEGGEGSGEGESDEDGEGNGSGDSDGDGEESDADTGKPSKGKGKGKGKEVEVTDADLNDLSDDYEKGQGESEIKEDPFTKLVNEICEAMIEAEEKEMKEAKNKLHNSRYIDRSAVISYGSKDKIVIEEPNSESFLKVYNEIGPQITHVRDRIAIHLKSISDSKTLYGLRRGQLDHQRLYQTALGTKTVMKKVFPGFDFSTAVQIVVDLSGSMGHCQDKLARYQMAMQMAIILAEVFQLLKIPFEITGFNTGGDSEPSTPAYQGSRKLYFRTEQVLYHVFKAFGDDYSLESVKHRLGSIHSSGSNIDHEVIRWSAARLMQQKEKRKLQIILSDGQPCGGEILENELRIINRRIVQNGIGQFAFGLQCECVKEYYEKYTVLENMDDLNTVALNIFVDFLMSDMQNKLMGRLR
jgi:cobalamin biosynthesis protein CobT